MDFVELHRKIYTWVPYHSIQRHGPNGRWEIVRQLTDGEWAAIEKLLSTEGSGYFCQMSNSEFGFQLALAIFQDALFPGVHPDCVFLVRPNIMPGYDDDNRKSHPEERWNRMWDVFSKYTHSERNKRILAFYEMEEPKNKVHYAY